MGQIEIDHLENDFIRIIGHFEKYFGKRGHFEINHFENASLWSGVSSKTGNFENRSLRKKFISGNESSRPLISYIGHFGSKSLEKWFTSESVSLRKRVTSKAHFTT